MASDTKNAAFWLFMIVLALLVAKANGVSLW